MRCLRSKVRFVLLLLLASCGMWQNAFAQFRAIIPFTEENGKLVADVVVNGQRGRFLIDTGAPCSVSYSFAQRLGLQAGGVLGGTDSNGNDVQTHLVKLDTLRVGGVSFTRLDAVRWQQGAMVEQFGIDGILGYNLMKMGVVYFDSRRHRVMFTNHPLPTPPDSVVRLPLVPHPMVARVVVQLGQSQQDTVMFDSGASSFYEMRRPRYETLSADTTAVRLLARGHGTLSMGAAGIGPSSLKYRVLIPQFKLGKATFRQVVTVTTDAEDSRMGTELLRFGDVIIDFPQQQFYFLPFRSSSQPSLYYQDWDVVLTQEDDYIVAGMIWNDRLPLRGGEIITEINGVRILGPEELRAGKQQQPFSMPGDTAQIKYIDKETGKERSLTIQRR